MYVCCSSAFACFVCNVCVVLNGLRGVLVVCKCVLFNVFVRTVCDVLCDVVVGVCGRWWLCVTRTCVLCLCFVVCWCVACDVVFSACLCLYVVCVFC